MKLASSLQAIFLVWSQFTSNMDRSCLVYTCCYGSFGSGCQQSLEQPLPLLPDSPGTKLNMHGLKTMQVSVVAVSFILGNIFQVDRVAAFDGPSKGSANSKACVASIVCSPLLHAPPLLEQRLNTALIYMFNDLADWIKMQSSG